MPDQKFSANTAASQLDGTEIVPIVQSGSSRRTTTNLINRKVTNYSTAAQSVTASTLTNIVGSNLAVPTGNTIIASTIFQWKVVISKTAVGTLATVFHVRLGTLGTTSDTAVLTFTMPAGTAAIDCMRVDIMMNVRTTGASGVLQGTFATVKNAGTIVGWYNIPTLCITATSAATNLTTANLIASVSVTTGATIVGTVNQVVSEVVNI